MTLGFHIQMEPTVVRYKTLRVKPNPSQGSISTLPQPNKFRETIQEAKGENGILMKHLFDHSIFIWQAGQEQTTVQNDSMDQS